MGGGRRRPPSLSSLCLGSGLTYKDWTFHITPPPPTSCLGRAQLNSSTQESGLQPRGLVCSTSQAQGDRSESWSPGNLCKHWQVASYHGHGL